MVYVGSYGAVGLRTGDVDPATGGLTITSEYAVADVSWLASHDGRLYATNEHADGSVTVLDPETLAVLGTQSSHGDAPTHLSVSPDGRHLLVANYGAGVTVLPLDGPATDVVAGVHAHQVLPDPGGQWVLAVDIGTDSVDVHRLADGKLQHHQRVAAGPGPRHVVWAGSRAFVVCEYAPAVLTCSWDAAAGKLTVLDSHETGEPGDNPAEGVVSSDGRFLYVTNRGSNTVATFEIGADLRRLPGVSSGGNWPRHAALDPTERWLYVANQRSGTVTWLPRDPDTGVLSPAVGETKVDDVAMVFFG